MRLLPPDSPHGWTPYVWLAYCAGFAGFPFAYGPGSVGWLVHVLGFVAFIALYFRGYWEEGGRRLAVSVALAALGVALSPVNPGALMFFIYATAFVGDARTGRPAAVWIGGLTLAGVVTAWWAGWFAPFMMAGVAVFAPAIGFVNVSSATTRRRDATLRVAQAEVARLAAEAERHRIASDVHDLLGHSLSVIVLKAELAKKLIARDPNAAAIEVADIERTSREALAEVRRAVTGFRAAVLADEWARARSVLQTAQLNVTQIPDQISPLATEGLSRQAEHALSMALREAVTNVIRHAGATACRLTVMPDGDHFRLEVADDGRGSDRVEGNGLQGMRARLKEVGGQLERDSPAGSHGGTRLTVTVPLAEKGSPE